MGLNAYTLGVDQGYIALRKSMRLSREGKGHWLKVKAIGMTHLRGEKVQVLCYVTDCL